MSDSTALSILEVLAIALVLALLLKPSFAEAVSRLLAAHAAALRKGRAAYKTEFVVYIDKNRNHSTYEIRGGILTNIKRTGPLLGADVDITGRDTA